MLGTADSGHDPAPFQVRAPSSARLIVFKCANSPRADVAPIGAVGQAPQENEPDWPIPAVEIAVPCSGKLQPEHLLKAFEAGADAVCVLACAEGDCHYLEGSRRAIRRVEYVRRLLEELGLGAERLMMFHLSGFPHEDMAPALALRDGSRPARLNQQELSSRLAAIRTSVAARFDALAPNPLRQGRAAV